MSEEEKTLAKNADKYVIRFPDGMRSQIEKLAKERGISMNTTIVDAIQRHLAGQERESQLLDILQERMTHGSSTAAQTQEEADADRDYLDGLQKNDD